MSIDMHKIIFKFRIYNLFTEGPVRAAYTLELVDLKKGQNMIH